jgi:hypothetical protein
MQYHEYTHRSFHQAVLPRLLKTSRHRSNPQSLQAYVPNELPGLL